MKRIIVIKVVVITIINIIITTMKTTIAKITIEMVIKNVMVLVRNSNNNYTLQNKDNNKIKTMNNINKQVAYGIITIITIMNSYVDCNNNCSSKNTSCKHNFNNKY